MTEVPPADKKPSRNLNRGGRPRGSKNKTTKELRELAEPYAPAALKVLVEIARHGISETARVMAANALLDRAYGKPRQAVEHSGSLEVPSLNVIVRHGPNTGTP